MISGSISLPFRGSISPFPHGTGSLSVTGEYLALEGGPPRFSQRFTCADLLGIRARYDPVFAYGAVTRYGHPFQSVWLTVTSPYRTSHNPGLQAVRFGLFRVRSPLLAESLLISTPLGTEMFHFPRFAPCTYGFSTW
jgi:hypothetical protein